MLAPATFLIILFWPDPSAEAVRRAAELGASVLVTPPAARAPAAPQGIDVIAEAAAGSSAIAAAKNAGFRGVMISAPAEESALAALLKEHGAFIRFVSLAPPQALWDVSPAQAVIRAGHWPGLQALDNAAGATEQPGSTPIFTTIPGSKDSSPAASLPSIANRPRTPRNTKARKSSSPKRGPSAPPPSSACRSRTAKRLPKTIRAPLPHGSACVKSPLSFAVPAPHRAGRHPRLPCSSRSGTRSLKKSSTSPGGSSSPRACSRSRTSRLRPGFASSPSRTARHRRRSGKGCASLQPPAASSSWRLSLGSRSSLGGVMRGNRSKRARSPSTAPGAVLCA